MMRTAEITRKTAETDIRLKLDLDGRGKSSIDSGVGFLDHMLTLSQSTAGSISSFPAKAIPRWTITTA